MEEPTSPDKKTLEGKQGENRYQTSEAVREKKKIKEKITKFQQEQQKEPEQVQVTKFDQFKEFMGQILEHTITTIVMTLITLYALFGDDIRVLTVEKDGDPGFWIMNIVCLCAFSIEIMLASIAKQNYWLGFFFWLDFISTLSLLLDIGWVSDAIFGSGDQSQAANAAQLARAGRTSRVGTRAGRIVRIIRLIRLVKLYKSIQQVQESEEKMLAGEEEDQEQEKHQNQNQNQESHQDHQQQNHNLNQLQSKLVSETPPKKVMLATKLPPIENKQLTDEDNKKDGPSKPIAIDKLKDEEQEILKMDQGHADKDKKEPAKDVLNQAKDIIDLNNERIKQQNSQLEDPRKRNLIKQSSTVQANQPNQQKQESQMPEFTETKVGQQLSDSTTKKVIILVLSIMICIPIFSAETYTDSITSYDNGLRYIYEFCKSNNGLGNMTQKSYFDFHNSSDNRYTLLYYNITFNNCSVIYKNPDTDKDKLRTSDVQIYNLQNEKEDQMGYAVTDIRIDQMLNAILSIIRTVFVSVVLGAGAMMFSKDAEDLVVQPIEQMLKKVKLIANNPLEAAQIEEKEAIALEKLESDPANAKLLAQMKEEEKMETSILEKLIIKVGALLAVGFGEAGSEIIAENMKKGGEVDPMLPGKKMMAIFGFCDIRNFTDATEVLQTGVMLFVNEIAEIAHSTVDSYCGQSNKNIGDAFLLVWKYKETDYVREGNTLTLKNEPLIKEMSDLPVICFLKIMSGINLSKKLKKYKENPGLNARLPNYSVKMGFGLHVGWAIEGAIGSNFKIDASYLSPNVNMASRLEAATKQFGSSILISGALYNTLTDKMKSNLRHIDRVTVKGSIQPIDLYTCDVNFEHLIKRAKETGLRDRFDNSSLSKAQRKKKRVRERIKRDHLKKDLIEMKKHTADFFQSDKELLFMRETFQPEFYQIWEKGFKHYLDGNWPAAKEQLEITLKMHPLGKDGPSNTLLEVIHENNGKAPGDWKGFRVLTEK